MLYVSTRDRTASYTAYRALHENYTPDGGRFVPFRLHVYGELQLEEMASFTFGQRVAVILEQFSGKKLSGLAVDLAIGKNPFHLKTIGHKAVIGELWQNANGHISYYENALYGALTGETVNKPSWWARIVIRIALLFGLYPLLREQGVLDFHIIATWEDPVSLLAAWYARKMGLPIGDIVYCCAEDSAMWEFFSFGQICGTMQEDAALEQLLHATVGQTEVRSYLEAASKKKSYLLGEELLATVNQGVFPVVISNSRLPGLISSIFSTNKYIASFDTACAFGGLQDFRSHTGQTGAALIFAMQSPELDTERICAALSIQKVELKKFVDDMRE